MNISDLKALILHNIILKYADDIDLVVPPSNAATIDTELKGITDWASQNNLVLNYSKSYHMVVRRPRFPRDHESIAEISSIKRVFELKVLGVHLHRYFVNVLRMLNIWVPSLPRTIYALRTLRAHGLCGEALWSVTRAHIISRLTYASSAWWGFCNAGGEEPTGSSGHKIS